MASPGPVHATPSWIWESKIFRKLMNVEVALGRKRGEANLTVLSSNSETVSGLTNQNVHHWPLIVPGGTRSKGPRATPATPSGLTRDPVNVTRAGNYFPSGTSVLTVLDTARETRKSCHALGKLSVSISIVFEKSMCHKPSWTKLGATDSTPSARRFKLSHRN